MIKHVHEIFKEEKKLFYKSLYCGIYCILCGRHLEDSHLLGALFIRFIFKKLFFKAQLLTGILKVDDKQKGTYFIHCACNRTG